MTSFRALLHNEWIKASRYRAFHVALAFFAAILALAFGARHRMSVRNPDRVSFNLPESWGRILSDTGPVPGMFVVTLLLFLLVNEFAWRTGRQNVIDGLGRGRFFAAKVALVPALAALVLLVMVAVGGGIAALGPDAAGVSGAVVRPEDLRAMAATFLAFCGFGSFALFVGMTVRSPAPAIGASLVYLTGIEQIFAPLLASNLIAEGDLRLAYVVRWLPGSVFQGLVAPARRGLLEIAIAAAGGTPAPGTVALVLATLSWIFAFLAGGYLALRHRDL